MTSSFTKLENLSVLAFLLLFFLLPSEIVGFASNPALGLGITDRFRATCPADTSTIAQFDPSLISQQDDDDDGSTWVAIYRSSNNMPSVLVKDSFLTAMRIATEVQTDGASQSTAIDNSSISDQIEESSGNSSVGVNANTPVAIAKLSPSTIFNDKWVIENMRCSLKKEDTDDNCDGNSEHAEAISVCIDELILHHLKQGRDFDGKIRTKATLVSGILLDERGFKEVDELSRDMATHISDLNSSLMKYSERVVATVSKAPGARDRALQILNYLGKQDVMEEDQKSQETETQNEDDDYDPWAGIKQFI